SGGELLERTGAAEVEPLAVVDADVLQELDRRIVADELGDRPAAQAARDVHDRTHDQLVGGVGDEVGDELAVDLQVVELEVLEVVEGGEPRTEVVQREMAAEAAQLPRE